MKRVVVSGANGFIGRNVCAYLCDAGMNVRALIRQPDAGLPHGVEPFVVSSFDDPTVSRALEGADYVVHLAARVHVMNETARDPLEEYRRTNVAATRTFLETAVRSGVGCFVFISSVKAVADSATTPVNEQTVPNPADPYGKTKLEAERFVSSYSREHPIRTPILRLPLVYGPGVKGNMLRLFRLVNRGIPLPLGGLRNQRSLVNTDNVATAIEKVMTVSAAGSTTFFVSDAERVSTAELVREIGRALGKKARLVPAPERLLRLAAKSGDLLSRFHRMPLTTAAVDRLVGSFVVDSALLSETTGWRPHVSLAEGLKRTAIWFRREA